MRLRSTKLLLLSSAIVLAAFGSSLTSCSGCGEGSAGDGTDSTSTTSGSATGASADGGAGSNGGSGTGSTSGSGSDTASQAGAGAADASAVTLTPAEERTKTGDEMRGLRAILKAELDAVRARLGKTADAAAKEADKTRAAELAQGLERIDRAIKAIDEADDVSWGTIRESQLKEAGEVRAWMAKYGMNVSA